MTRFVVAAAVAALLSVGVRCFAQGDDPAKTHHGNFVLRPDAQLGLAVPNAAQRRAAFAAADKLVAILRHDDALATPIGYAAVVHRAAGVTGAGGDSLAPGLPVHYAVAGGLNYYAMEDDGHGGQRVGDGGGSFPFLFAVNGIGRLSDMEVITPPFDHGPPILTDFRVTGQFRGHAVYNGECVFIARRPSVPPFVPVTQARYLTLQILKARADSTRHAAEHRQMDAAPGVASALEQWNKDRPKREADMRVTYEQVKKLDPKSAQAFLDSWRASEADAAARLASAAPSGADDRIRELARQGSAGEGTMIAAIQAQLNALSPAERKAPAAILEQGAAGDKLGKASDPESQPLVQINPAFFDKTLAVDVPQLVTVCLPGLQAGVEIKRWEWNDQRAHDAALIRDHLDWAALEALVKP